MQREKTMFLGFEPISLSKTPPRAEVTAREMPENLHLHTCEDFLWLTASGNNFQNLRKCSRIIYRSARETTAKVVRNIF